MRNVRRITLAAALAAMVITGIVIDRDAVAAASASHNLMVPGTAFRPLDARVSSQLLPSSGGAVYAEIAPANSTPSDIFLEAVVNLPPGALVDRVTFFYRDCGSKSGNSLTSFYVFAYDPAHEKGRYELQPAAPPLSCGAIGTTTSFVRNISPPLKVSAAKAYVLGFQDGLFLHSLDPDSDPDVLLGGAKVRYSCPDGC